MKIVLYVDVCDVVVASGNYDDSSFEYLLECCILREYGIGHLLKVRRQFAANLRDDLGITSQ